MIDEEKRFGLGAGKLYIAPAGVSAEHAVSSSWYAGPTKGGVTLAYSAKVHEITDFSGRLVRSVRYGERIRLEGELVRLYPEVLARVIGAQPSPGTLDLGGVCREGRTARVRVVLVCRRYIVLTGYILPAGETEEARAAEMEAARRLICRIVSDPDPLQTTLTSENKFIFAMLELSKRIGLNCEE